MKHLSFSMILAVLVTSMVLLAGCGGGDKVAEQQVLEIGFVGPLTGDVAVFGEPVRNAVQMAVDDVNAKGGVNGKRVKVIYEDGMCDGKQAATAAQKLVHIDHVPFIMGGFCSSETLSMAPITAEKGVIQMSAASTAPKVKDAGDHVYRVVPSDNGQAAVGAKYLADKGVKKVAVLSRNDEWGVGLKGAFVASAKSLGMEVVAEESLEPSAADVKTQIVKIQQTKPDAVYMATFTTEGVAALKQMKELGFQVELIAGDAMKSDDTPKTGGDAVEGLVVTLPGTPTSEAYQSFAAKYRQKFGADAPAYTPEAYDVANIAFAAFKNSDGTSAGLKNYLNTMGEYDGASGTYEFDADGEVTKPYDFFVINNGQFEPLEH